MRTPEEIAAELVECLHADWFDRSGAVTEVAAAIRQVVDEARSEEAARIVDIARRRREGCDKCFQVEAFAGGARLVCVGCWNRMTGEGEK